MQKIVPNSIEQNQNNWTYSEDYTWTYSDEYNWTYSDDYNSTFKTEKF